MKKTLMTMGAAALLLASCSSDDNGSSSSSIDQNLLHKKWYYVSYVVNGQTYPYDDHEACGKDYIELKADGSVRDVDVVDCQEQVDEYTYTVDGKTITLSYMGVSRAGEVLKLTSNALEVKANFDFDNDGDVDSVKEIYTATP